MNLELILTIVAALVGVPALIALLIDIGKWAGWVTDGNAGKVSAALNVIVLVPVAVLVNFFPQVDIPGWDVRLVEIVKFAGLIFAYIIQIVGTKAFHLLYSRGLKVKAFSLTK